MKMPEADAPRSAASYFATIVAQVRYAMRYPDEHKLHQFLASEKFISNMAGLPSSERVRALGIVSEGMGAPPPVRRKSKFPAPRRCTQWTELNKARFRKAWLQEGHEAAAKALGISYKAAAIAAKRQGIIVAKATPALQKAA